MLASSAGAALEPPIARLAIGIAVAVSLTLSLIAMQRWRTRTPPMHPSTLATTVITGAGHRSWRRRKRRRRKRRRRMRRRRRQRSSRRTVRKSRFRLKRGTGCGAGSAEGELATRIVTMGGAGAAPIITLARHIKLASSAGAALEPPIARLAIGIAVAYL